MDTHSLLHTLLALVMPMAVAFLVSALSKVGTAAVGYFNHEVDSIKMVSARRMALTLARNFMQTMTKPERVAYAKDMAHAALASHFADIPSTTLDSLIEEAVREAKAEDAYLAAQVASLDKPQGGAAPKVSA